MAMDPVKDGGNWYQYCSSNPLRYWDPLGLTDTELPSGANPKDYNHKYSCKYNTVNGMHAHITLQTYFLSTFVFHNGGRAYTEVTVDGYQYTKSGTGRIDMLLAINNTYEIYELKPVTQIRKPRSIYELTGNYNGEQQREAYIRAFEKTSVFPVNYWGNSFNPDHLDLVDIQNPSQYFTYYTVPEKPGMIYWTVNDRNQDESKKVTEPATENENEKKTLEELIPDLGLKAPEPEIIIPVILAGLMLILSQGTVVIPVG